MPSWPGSSTTSRFRPYNTLHTTGRRDTCRAGWPGLRAVRGSDDYRVGMMPSPSASDGEHTVSASTPREIRAALTGEATAHFDREYRRAMADAAESLDLSCVISMLRRWQRVAWSARDDAEAHRHMLACADE